jgi:subtilisin
MRPVRIAPILIACALAITPAAQARPRHGYIVVYDTGRIGTVAARTAGLEHRYRFASRLRFTHAISGFAARLSARQAGELRRSKGIAMVARDRTAHVAARDPVVPGESVSKEITRIGAATSAGVHQPSSGAVAVIDTGVDLDHPDLNVAGGANCTGTGPPEDDHGHGTYLAGIIGARNNGAGVVGVAPGTQLYAVKSLLSNGAGPVSNVICGIDWVTANAAALGIRVANVSIVTLGGPSGCNSDPLHLAICNSTAAGVTYVVAAGNDHRDIAASPRALPAAFPEVLTVSAMSDSDGIPGGIGATSSCTPGQLDDWFTTFSNFALAAEDAAHMIAAPGVCVRSTALGGGYSTDSGTSPAAAFVTGVVALCMGVSGGAGPCTGLSPAESIQQVRADARANATRANGFEGDPLHPVEVNFGYLVSAFDPSVRRPPRVDIVRLRVRRVENRRLLVSVKIGQAGTVEARATATARGRSARRRSLKHFRFRRAAAEALPERTVKLRLVLSRRSLRAARRALRAGRRLHVTVTVLAKDESGHRAMRHRRLNIAR